MECLKIYITKKSHEFLRNSGKTFLRLCNDNITALKFDDLLPYRHIDKRVCLYIRPFDLRPTVRNSIFFFLNNFQKYLKVFMSMNCLSLCSLISLNILNLKLVFHACHRIFSIENRVYITYDSCTRIHKTFPITCMRTIFCFTFQARLVNLLRPKF